jgi:hypothetical protein
MIANRRAPVDNGSHSSHQKYSMLLSPHAVTRVAFTDDAFWRPIRTETRSSA